MFRQLFGLTGDVAIVTGGLGRLGSEYVKTLAHAGAAVAAFDICQGSNPTLNQLLHEGYPIVVRRVDVTNRAEVRSAVNEVSGTLGAPTILINNAGRGSSPSAGADENGRFEQYPEEAWDTMLDSHLKGMFLMSQAFVECFRRSRAGQRQGSIINISSTYGLVSPDQSVYDFRRQGGTEYYKPVAYSVAKSGVLNFTRWLAEYCAPLGIRVNTLAPGGVREASHAEEFVEAYVKRTPLGRMASEQDYNAAVLFLASGGSAYMTGSLLVVDGGWTAR
jgi:NAD(P)-dependent dehydrogenase (short-subunit alcohol dehydrogenase family)